MAGARGAVARAALRRGVAGLGLAWVLGAVGQAGAGRKMDGRGAHTCPDRRQAAYQGPRARGAHDKRRASTCTHTRQGAHRD